MGCASGCVRWLLFIFNFLFALGGLAILVLGVLIKLNQSEVLSIVEENVPVHLSMPAAVLIAIGAIIFIIAFFGCCGAARESHCMIVTFAVLLLTLLVVQVALAAFTFIRMKDGTFGTQFNKQMKKLFDKYSDNTAPDQKTAQAAVNSIQSLVHCCGYYGKSDFGSQIPYSCCDKKDGEFCSSGESYNDACGQAVVPYIESAMNRLGGLALAIAAVELFGVIFSFCLANSIRNVERRGYKV